MSSTLLKKLGIVTAVLILLWVVYMYHQVPHHPAPYAKAADQAQQILLERGAKKLQLSKKGEAWMISSGSGTSFEADAEPVKTLLLGLKDIQIEDEISDRADRAAEYEVDAASGTRVNLKDAKGADLADGIFGKQSPDMAHIYFRYPDKPHVFLARGLVRRELGILEVNAWRSRHLVDIPETKIQAITMEGPSFKTELVRTSTDVWTMNGKAVETGPVNALVGTVAHLVINEFVDPAASPNLTYEGLTYGRLYVKSTDSAVEIRIGPEDIKSKRYPVSVGKDSGLVWLPESLIHSLQQKPSAFPEKKKA